MAEPSLSSQPLAAWERGFIAFLNAPFFLVVPILVGAIAVVVHSLSQN